MRDFFPKTSQNGWLFYITVPRDVGGIIGRYVGEKVVKYINDGIY